MTLSHNWITGQTSIAMTPDELFAIRDGQRERIRQAIDKLAVAAHGARRDMEKVLKIRGVTQ